jgi:hypothetical protein
MISDKMIGVHIRQSDQMDWIKVNHSAIQNKISGYIQKGYKVFLATDNPNVEKVYQKKFGESLISFQNPFGFYLDKFENNPIGVKNSVVDLYLLAECSHIMGTKGSSFSWCAWILSENSTFEIHS